jgi:hypothetical protein
MSGQIPLFGCGGPVNIGGWSDQNEGPSPIACSDRSPVAYAISQVDIEEVKAD